MPPTTSSTRSSVSLAFETLRGVVDSTTPRKVSNASETDDLVLLVIGGKDGYVERDGHMVDEADIARRAAFGKD